MDNKAKPLLTPEAAQKHFHVVPDCCLLCGIPESIAPELFETGKDHCTVKRQPITEVEVDKVVRAMWSSEVDCIRYSGTDEVILTRLGQAGLSAQADDPRGANAVPLTRDRVTFTLPGNLRGPDIATKIAAAFLNDLRRQGMTVLPAFFGKSTVHLSWFRREFHSITFACAEEDQTMTAKLRSKSALVGVAWCVDDWLRSSGATAISWQSNGNSESEKRRHTPI
jgi:hypothetical protein